MRKFFEALAIMAVITAAIAGTWIILSYLPAAVLFVLAFMMVHYMISTADKDKDNNE